MYPFRAIKYYINKLCILFLELNSFLLITLDSMCHFLMSCQGSLMCILWTTNVAFKILLLHVQGHVGFQMGLLLKAFPTGRTVMIKGSTVFNLKVETSSSWSFVFFATGWTFVCSTTRVKHSKWLFLFDSWMFSSQRSGIIYYTVVGVMIGHWWS